MALLTCFLLFAFIGPQLNAQLEGWLSQVQSTKRPAAATAAPHAGYSYRGSHAAHASNKWIHLFPGAFSSLGLLIMCPFLNVHFSVCVCVCAWHLCMILVLTKRFTENYGRKECLNACLCRQMKMNTVLKCICLMQLKPWKAMDEFTIIPVLVRADWVKRTGIQKTLQ